MQCIKLLPVKYHVLWLKKCESCKAAGAPVAWWPGEAGGANAPPPAGLKNGGATEHKGRLKMERL